MRVLQGLLEQLTLRLEGEHLLRRPLVHVLAEGFEIERRERLKWGLVERICARKPARYGRSGCSRAGRSAPEILMMAETAEARP